MNPKLFSLGLLVFSLALAGCVASPPIIPPANQTIPFSVLENGSFSGIANESYFFITTQRDWDSFVSGNSFNDEVKSLTIDFATENVIVVAMGQKPSSGYSIFVKSVEWKNKCLPGQTCLAVEPTVTVIVQTKSPAPGDAVLTVMTAPFEIVKVSKSNLPAGTDIKFVVDGISHNITLLDAAPVQITKIIGTVSGGFTGAESTTIFDLVNGKWVLFEQNILAADQALRLDSALSKLTSEDLRDVNGPSCCDIPMTRLELTRGNDVLILNINGAGEISGGMRNLLDVMYQIEQEVLVPSLV